jgi:hypothetical protein
MSRRVTVSFFEKTQLPPFQLCFYDSLACQLNIRFVTTPASQLILSHFIPIHQSLFNVIFYLQLLLQLGEWNNFNTWHEKTNTILERMWRAGVTLCMQKWKTFFLFSEYVYYMFQRYSVARCLLIQCNAVYISTSFLFSLAATLLNICRSFHIPQVHIVWRPAGMFLKWGICSQPIMQSGTTIEACRVVYIPCN